MHIYNNISQEHIATLESQGCRAEDWRKIKTAEGFDPAGIVNCSFRGEVNIGRNVYIRNIGSYISNYTIGDGAYIENVALLETTGESGFGNGVLSAVVNEGGGREVPLLDNLTAQTAYMMAMYRHRPATIRRLMEMAGEYARSVTSPMGIIGAGTRITNSGVIRNVRTSPGTIIEGASILSNGSVNCTPQEPSFIGAGTKMFDFIIRTGCEIEGGSLLRRCFVGEGVKVCGLTATDSLFFANSHFENSELCSVFAGPFTVSHHKSSLLIAGMFSFFNAGSGSNQSNHLFKTGPVHQGVHRRGCKFGSDAYVVLPVRTGAYTIVIGRHKSHHDTDNFPYSYIMEESGKSVLVPGINLINSGTVRDMEKWRRRDKRGESRRDLINFEEHNPFITEKICRGIEISEELLRKESDEYVWHGLRIRRSMLRKGLSWYKTGRDKFLGAMLAEAGGTPDGSGEYSGPWVDVAGMYTTKRAVEEIMDAIENGALGSLEQVDEAFAGLFARYAANARSWALTELARELGREPSEQDIAAAIERGAEAAAHLDRLTEQDRNKDRDASMAIGYGVDSDDEAEILEDYRRVRGL